MDKSTGQKRAKRKIFFLKGKFGRVLSPKEANKKSVNLCVFVKMKKKHGNGSSARHLIRICFGPS